MTMLRCLAINLAVAMIALQAHDHICTCLAQCQDHLERPRYASPKDSLKGIADLIITVSLRQYRYACSMRTQMVRALMRADFHFMEEEETAADSHMLTPRANPLTSDEHDDFFDWVWAFYDQMS